MKVIRRVGILSVARTLAIIYGCLGFIVGAFVAMISVLGGFAGLLSEQGRAAGVAGMFFGVGAVILFPILYACLGLIVGSIVATIYNAAAKAFGGVEIDID